MAIEIPEQPVNAPENALIGEDTEVAREADVSVLAEDVAAQTTGPASVVADTVAIHETAVSVDKVITDPHSPEAVQIPDAGRGSLDLPIHALGNPRPEDVFAAAAAEDAKSSKKK